MKQVRALLATAVFLVLAPGVVAALIPFWISGWQFNPPFLGFEPVRWFGVVLIVLAFLVGGSLAVSGAALAAA